MQKNNFVWMVGGEAGYGIMSAGHVFSKTFSRGGLHIFSNNEYPSLVRGGHNTFTVRVSDKPALSCVSNIDLLVALNKETIEIHKENISQNGGIIYDASLKDIEVRKDINLYPIPLEKFAQETGEKKIMMNSVAMGASLALINYDFKIFESVIEDIFGAKGPKIVKADMKAAKNGYNYIKKNYKDFEFQVSPVRAGKKMIMTGNEAIALGAVNAGCKMISAYPMTPASSILHNLSAWTKDANIIAIQPEDEIAAINMIIGAGYAGIRAMTATSGGGFALMVEGLGLAGETETPIVVVEAQRPGPATGVPTRTDQSDLKFVINAAQGEFPRVVLAPGDVDEAFYLTQEAFNLAEKLQTPVLILSDKYLSESIHTSEGFDLKKVKINRGSVVEEKDLKKLEAKEFFERYKLTANNISPRSYPGMKNGMFISTSDEHNEVGLADESTENRNKMMDKRMGKMELARKEVPKPIIHGSKKSDIVILGWGSTKGSILEAIEQLKVKVKFVQLTCLHPFPEEIEDIVHSAKKVIVVEQNSTSQLSALIREHTGFEVKHKVLKYDSRPMPIDWLYNELKGIIK